MCLLLVEWESVRVCGRESADVENAFFNKQGSTLLQIYSFQENNQQKLYLNSIHFLLTISKFNF